MEAWNIRRLVLSLHTFQQALKEDLSQQDQSRIASRLLVQVCSGLPQSSNSSAGALKILALVCIYLPRRAETVYQHIALNIMSDYTDHVPPVSLITK
jgi:hypothetical protein